MAGRVSEILQIRKQERGLLLLIFIQAVFTGIFFGGFDISLHAIFFNVHGPSTVPDAYIVSGIAGIFFMLIYIYLSTRLPFKLFIIGNYIVTIIIASCIFYFSSVEVNTRFIGIGFALMFPINIIIFLSFWRNVREILTPQQTKRLNVIIQLGFYGGIVAASYGTILFLFVSSDINLILAGSTISLAVGVIIQLIIGIKHRFSQDFLHKAKKINPLRSKFIELFYARNTFLLLLFITLSAVTGYILHFNFIISTRLSYPHIIGFAKFLGLFVGSMFLFIFFVDKLFIRKLLYSYDSPYSLVLVPVAVILVLVIIVTVQYTLGTTIALARFSYSFMFIAMVKIVYEMSKFDIEIPSLRVLFHTLDIRFNSTIIPRIEGSVRSFGILVAGVILYFIIKLKFVRILHINLLAIIIAVIWFIVAIALVKSYQKALQNTVNKFRRTKKTDDKELLLVDQRLFGMVNHKSPGKVIAALSVSEKMQPIEFEKHLSSLLAISIPEVQEFIIKKMDNNTLLPALQVLKSVSFDNKQLDTYRKNLVQRFEQKISLGHTENQIEKLTHSKNVNDRILAAELIGYVQKKEFSVHLVNLSRDFEPDVKQASIRSMARIAVADTCHTLIGILNSPVHYAYAFEALVRIGDDITAQLEDVFNTPGIDSKLQARIVKIFGKIGSPQAMEYLLGKLDRQNRIVTEQTIVALRESKFQCTPKNINRILNVIVRTINIMSWNYSALNRLKGSKKFRLLKDAFIAELNYNYRILYHLLSLAYNSNMVTNIRQLLIEGSDTDISFAVELLDQIVLDDVKQILFPVIENLSDSSRIKQLQYFFQNEKLPVDELIPEIIVRDFNLISIFTKARAIYCWYKSKVQINNILISTIFHPHKLLRETAAYVIHRIDPSYLENLYPRLDAQYVQDIQTSIHNITAGNDYLTLHKISFLKTVSVFQGITEDILFEIAAGLKPVKLLKDESRILSDEQNKNSLVIIYEGNMSASISKDEILNLRKRDLFYADLYFTDNPCNILFSASEDSVCFTLNKEILDMLAFDYSEIQDALLELLDTHVK